MNTQINPTNFKNYPINKKLNEKNIIIDTYSIGNKDLSQNQDHNMNSLFKVITEEKEPPSPHNISFMNGDKNSNKGQSKNINIIKPKFVTRTMPNDNLKLKNNDESQSLNLNLSLNLSSSAFQPQIIKKDNKEFKVKLNNKIYNLLLDVKNETLKLKLYEINDNIYLLKYFYENNFTMNDLKQLHKFFYLFDNVSDTLKELEKLLTKNKYNVYEDLENKKAKIQIKVILLDKEENIEFSLLQKAYSKDNLFEILCKKVSSISSEYGQRMFNLERDNQFLLMHYFHLVNTINPMNMNYPINQRENNINKINNTYNNNMNINKKISLIKKISNDDNKYNDNNKENINNYEYDDYNNDISNDISITDNFYDDNKDISGNKKLTRKKRGRKKSSNSNSSNKNNTLPLNINKNTDIENINNINGNSIHNNDSSNNDNYFFLRDIKSKKLVKCKGLFEIIHTSDELFLIINKILYKLNKYKKNYNNVNYENKLQFSIIILFDSSLNGDSAYEFHKKCDLKYNTISIIETTSGHRFGGYTSECFESPNEYFDKKDNLSFVFSLDKMKIYDVIKGKYAISCDKNYGPYFRDDHICIVDEFLTKESGTCIKGKGFNTTKNYELNSGKKYFTIKRLQVFQIKIRKIN
jgi:hypothetical protein